LFAAAVRLRWAMSAMACSLVTPASIAARACSAAMSIEVGHSGAS
jgi:hypothetical protein